MDVTAAALPRSRRAFAAAALALAIAVPLTGAGGGSMTAVDTTGPQQTLVLRIADGAMSSVLAQVRSLGGTVEHRLSGIGSAVVRVPATAAASVRRTAGVLGATENAPVTLQNSSYDPTSDPTSMVSAAYATKTDKLWSGSSTGSPVTGAGIDVAVIDSGVAPVTGLNGTGKVVNGPDLSFDSQNASTRYLDTFGHGTFMAGIIAGRDPYTGNPKDNPNAYNGIAPDARIVSVKVADAYGNTDVSQVIAAIDWVVQHRGDPGMNIRVLNLSFGTPSLQSYLYDPLAYAAEIAWRKGIVVVVSAGNDGTGTGKLLNPAQDPYVLAVGASDSKGTKTHSDDTIPAFSTRGDGVRNPDLVAPGTSVQGLRVPGSFIDQKYGSTAAFGGRFFRGSGTSQAAAFVSGAAALLLQDRPSLTPDQVKALLTSSTSSLPAADLQAQGAGIVNVDAAAKSSTPNARQSFPLSSGTGTLDGARGAAKLTLNGVTLSGQKDIFGRPYAAATRAAQQATETSWVGGLWNGSSWAGSSWAGSSWAGSSWAGATWAGSSWAGSSWAGATWATGTWTGSSWAGSSWAGSSWAGSSWAGSSCAGSSWAGSSWAGSSWASGAWS
jgi:serine protease AprX